MSAWAYPDNSPAQVKPGQSLTKKLVELQSLRDNGVLTESEHEGAREKAIEKMPQI
jgi:hypothetical protein